MIPAAALVELARARRDDAAALIRSKRYDGAIYICGYAVELALKARICKTLGWTEFRTTDEYRSVKTHSLEVLLRFSGVERKIKAKLGVEWSAVKKWSPELRYDHTVAASASDAQRMLEATRKIMRAL